MARLIYAMLASLDGYVEDADGGFAWATPSEEVHAYANEIGASVDPDTVRAWVAAADRDVAIAGPEIAARAIAAGLVGEVHVIVAPVVVGGGKRLFPAGSRLDLRLVEHRAFADGFVALRYAVRSGSPVSRFFAMTRSSACRPSRSSWATFGGRALVASTSSIGWWSRSFQTREP